MNILILAQTPPPIHGAALINKAVLDILSTHPATHVEHVDISASKSIYDMQKSTLSKSFKSLSLFIQVCFSAFLNRNKITYINTAPGGMPSIRDYIFLTIASFRSTKVFAHFHGQLPENSIFLKLPNYLFKKNITFIFLDVSLIPENFSPPHKKTKTLYNFAPNEVAYKNINHSTSRAITIGFLANMLPAKGINTFLDSCAFELRAGYDFSVLIAGGWTAKYERTQYMKWLNDNPDISSRFTHSGSVNEKQKFIFFKQIDIFFYPTKNDAFPLVLLEAMASGSAILTTNIGAIRNIISDADLVCSSTDEISKKLRKLLDEPGTLKEKKSALRHRYYAEYSRAQFEQNLLAILGVKS